MSALARWRVVAVVALWYSLASVTGICSPEILSALIKPAPHGLGLSIAGAGLLLTVEMIANGSLSLAARLFDRYSSRTLLVSGFLATFAADIATTEAKGFGVLVALRAVAGAGLGVATVAVSRFIASSENPDRFSSVLLVISTTLSGSVLVIFGNSSPPVAAIFGILAGLAALGLGDGSSLRRRACQEHGCRKCRASRRDALGRCLSFATTHCGIRFAQHGGQRSLCPDKCRGGTRRRW